MVATATHTSPKRQAVKTQLAEKSLRHFVRQAWSVIEPGTELVPGFYIDAICDHLQAVAGGEITRLLITLPPGFLKSTLVSVLFPSWLWIDRPSFRFLTTSHDSDLAMRDAVRSRRVIASDWYQARWGDRFAMTTDQNVKTRYENDRTGHRISLGTGSGITGKRGDLIICLRYNVPIQTDRGMIPIGDVVEQRLPVKVLAYDHDREHAVWREIEAYERNPGRSCVQVTFSNGATIECTGDHPVYVVGCGYVPAGTLHNGDEVLTSEVRMHGLRQRVRSIPVPCGAGWQVRPVLFASVSGGCAQRLAEPVVERGTGRAPVRMVSAVIPGQERPGEDGEVLCRRLPDASVSSESGTPPQAGGVDLRLLRSRVQSPAVVSLRDELLFASVCQRLSLAAGQRRGERPLGARSGAEAVCAHVSAHCADDSGAGWAPVPAVRQDAGAERQGAGRSSHRLRQDERCPVESDQPLSAVPSADTWTIVARSPRVGRTTVCAVERIDTPEHTYNVRVAEHHNYFASGVLVHNCDDPHDSEDAYSETARETTIRWWNETVPSRLNDPKRGAKIVIQQRLHERDLAGEVASQGYEHLNLPMEYEPAAQQAVTSIGWKDPRTEPGELLDPVRYGPEEIDEKKKELGTAAYGAQYQQEPKSPEGGMFKRHWWQRYGALPTITRAELVVDSAFKEGVENDWSVFALWGTDGLGSMYLVNIWRARVAFPDLIQLGHDAHAWARSRFPNLKIPIVVEDKASGQSAIQVWRKPYYTKAGVLPALSVVPFIVKGTQNKIARADGVTPTVEGQRTFLPASAPWVEEFISEHADFPTGLHDDQVDTTSMGLTRLDLKRKPGKIVGV